VSAGSRSHRSGPLAALVTVVLLVVAGCATVPSSSSPVVVDTVRADSRADLVPPPLSGREPDLLVCDYLTASTSPTDRHAAARKYLTDGAASGWDDGASTTIVDNVDCLIDERAAERTTILMRGDSVGTLNATGQFAVDIAPRPFSLVLTLLRVNGQWRIDNPLSGVLMRKAEFQSAYRRLPVYFLDSGLDTVVPDPRWLVKDPDSLAARLIDLLVAGPSADLAPSVVTEFAPGVRLRSNVSKADNSGAPAASGGRGVRIDFGNLDRLDMGKRQLLAAQVVWTLDAAGVTGPYFLLADGAPLDDAHANGWTTADVVSTDPAASPGASVPLHALVGGALVSVGDSKVTPVTGPLGGYTTLQSAALSRDGQRVAAVARSQPNGTQLLVGVTGGGGLVVAAQGDTMTRPTWSVDGSAVWVAQNGSTVLRVSQDPVTGVPSTQQVDTSALGAPPGSITALRLSRDGVRAALVVGGRVQLALVTRTETGTVAFTSPRLVAPGLAATAVTLDWTNADTMLVVRTDPDRPVVSVTVDGAELRVLPGNNLSAPVRAVAASPTAQLVADSRGILTLSSSDTTGERIWRQVPGLGGETGPSAVPILPG